MKKHLKKIAAAIVLIMFVSAAAIGIYAGDYYHADEVAAQALQKNDTVTVQYIGDDIIAFCPHNAQRGLIFYPGGKVEYTAYAPLMESLAQNGIVSVLVKMPLNLAVLDINAADGIKDNFPSVETWYMAGHSLGGSMAASYIAQHTDDYKGLILLASYSTEDLSQADIDVISIYGSNDKVLNMENYRANYTNLPEDATEYVIEEGCHAYFGSYGEQDGDGQATITPQQQRDITVKTITGWMADDK